jgi:hypothetical protein
VTARALEKFDTERRGGGQEIDTPRFLTGRAEDFDLYGFQEFPLTGTRTVPAAIVLGF